MDKRMYNFEELKEIIRALRDENGCPWDRKQTHESLIPCLREEAQEAVEAIEKRDMENLCEELGDVLLQVMLHSQIASEHSDFTIEDVVTGLCEKMIRRHPHVFGESTVKNEEELLKQWEEIKKQEKSEKSLTNPL